MNFHFFQWNFVVFQLLINDHRLFILKPFVDDPEANFQALLNKI